MDDIKQVHIELAYELIKAAIEECGDVELYDNAILGLKLLYEQSTINIEQ